MPYEDHAVLEGGNESNMAAEEAGGVLRIKGYSYHFLLSSGGKRKLCGGGSHLMDCEVLLKEIAQAKGKTLAQVALRWVHEQGVSMLVKSFNKERMKEYMEIMDWELSEIPQRRGLPCFEFVSDDGPYKTVYKFWDGEI